MTGIRHLLYPFIFLLAYGNLAHSAANHSPTLCSIDDHIKQQIVAAFIEDTDLSDQFDEELPYILEENSSSNNDDDSSSNNDDFEQESNDVSEWHSRLHIAHLDRHLAFAGQPLRHNTAPLYLLNRVFRI